MRSETSAAHALLFEPIGRAGEPLAFPCDERGCVNLDALASKERADYLFARALRGRVYAARVLRTVEVAT